MGTWGLGVFEDDDAMNWAVDFQRAPCEQSLREAFEAAVKTKDYLERDLGSSALAAAEVLAAANGQPCEDIPLALRDWAVTNAAIAGPDLLARACAAIDRVLQADSSEKAESWLRQDDAAQWVTRMEALKHRLSRPQ